MKTNRTIRYCVPQFKYKCPQEWDLLTPTADDNIRHCQKCNHSVYFCTTDEETLAHARAGHCIAREIPDSSEMPMLVLGRPEVPQVNTPDEEAASTWTFREVAIEDALKNLDAGRVCPHCNYPTPVWRTHCRVCELEIGRVVPE